jgi:hypothetical protein
MKNNIILMKGQILLHNIHHNDKKKWNQNQNLDYHSFYHQLRME